MKWSHTRVSSERNSIKLFWSGTKLLLYLKPENSSILTSNNTKEKIPNHKGTRIVNVALASTAQFQNENENETNSRRVATN